MAETKYEKYFIDMPILKGHFVPRFVFFSSKFFGDKQYSVIWNCITEPFTMEEEPHSHDFDQFLHFYGGNSQDITDFDAEVEFSIGEEGEKHIITKNTIIHIPKGMIHCPLVFKVVNKPVIFMNVALTPQYVR